MEYPHSRTQLSLSKITLIPEALSMVLAEYHALRDEMLKRVDIMYQINALALIAPGTIFAYGLQNPNASLLFSYPVLAMCLAFAWSTNEKIIRRLSSYVKTHIEARCGEDNIGWEHYVSRHGLLGLGDAWAVVGIFLGTELLAIVLGWSVAMKSSPVVPLPLLLIISWLSSIITGIVLLRSFLIMRKKEPASILVPNINKNKKIK